MSKAKENWVIWEKKYKNGKIILYYGIIDAEILCEIENL